MTRIGLISKVIPLKLFLDHFHFRKSKEGRFGHVDSLGRSTRIHIYPSRKHQRTWYHIIRGRTVHLLSLKLRCHLGDTTYIGIKSLNRNSFLYGIR